ncbi:thiamine diphosphokinase [Paenibacillus sp. J2TS4]|uniref:thiamine diphosphokinase n=1 Tax=Paenibacillus sp. J2TS4 TaxID=2807194 RepID=UPI001B21E8F9|nr:thiamine diphosphokinase [Paenibacillus sp. J2TS4]GIP34049.1 thiamine pyrophosphokinase [Paenibacillus sp. J2TS4]
MNSKSSPEGDKVIIVAGGSLGDWAIREIERADKYIGADRGAEFLVLHGYEPDLAIGDFDSLQQLDTEQVRQASKRWVDCDPVMKDYTDTEMAFNEALALKPSEIILIGATGTRLDHSLANLHLLVQGLEARIRCKIVDASNEITLIDDELMVFPNEYKYLSLLPLSEEVHGITLEGFLYPLKDASLKIGQTLGISNIVTAGVGRITLAKGKLLVIRSKDN